jgi:hypothetical protein
MRREQAAQPLWLAELLAEPDGNLVVDTQLTLPGHVIDMESLRAVTEGRRPMIGNIGRGQTGTGLPLRAPVVRGGVERYIVTAVIRPDGVRDRNCQTTGPGPSWMERAASWRAHRATRH